MLKEHCKLNLLVIDDNLVDVIIYKKLFYNIADTVHIEHVLRVQHGIEYLLNEKNPLPQAILLDLLFPDEDGWSFLTFYENSPFKFEIPLFLITSSNNYGYQERSRRFSSVQNYYFKPIHMKEARDILKVIC
jgi:response regulator RpfG family c-di-GMP phosphodiesterase